MRSRISALLGRADGLADPWEQRGGGFRLAVKYSDSVRSYMRRAASNAIAWRSFRSDIRKGAAVCLTSLSRAAARLVVECTTPRPGAQTPAATAGQSAARLLADANASKL